MATLNPASIGDNLTVPEPFDAIERIGEGAKVASSDAAGGIGVLWNASWERFFTNMAVGAMFLPVTLIIGTAALGPIGTFFGVMAYFWLLGRLSRV